MSPLFWGIALGAASAFMLDPQQGRRRRALLRDKWVRGIRDGREFADAAGRDLRQRAEGARARLRSIGGSRATTEDRWSPGVRALAGGGAAVLFLYGLARGGISGLGAIVLGSAVLARAVGNQPLGEMVEEGRARLEEHAQP